MDLYGTDRFADIRDGLVVNVYTEEINMEPENGPVDVKFPMCICFGVCVSFMFHIHGVLGLWISMDPHPFFPKVMWLAWGTALKLLQVHDK